MRSLLLLSLLPLALALFQDDPELSLSQTVREAQPIDIRGIYLLQQTTGNADLCPNNITHTTWRRISDGNIGLPHNTIVQDGDRCDSASDERSLRFFSGTDYDFEFNPIGDADELPEDFVSVMMVSGVNVGIRNAAQSAGEGYLMGYEDSIRVCGGMSKFGIGTTAFLFRPTTADVEIGGLGTPLTPGMKYLVMVPRFQGTVCLYSSDVNGPDDSFRPIESEEPLTGSDEPTPSEEPTPSDEVPTISVGSGSDGDGQGGPGPVIIPGGERDPLSVDESPDPLLPVGVDFPTETIEPSGSPEDPFPSEEEDDDGVCFPAEAMVVLEDGRRKRMDELAIGDNVQVGHEQFSTIFAFTHKDASVRHEFITLKTTSAAISATAGHYIYINDKAARIETASVGDSLTLSTGTRATITEISKATRQGLYNPQTLHGDIIVDGIRASTYTRTVDPRVAHAVLAPVRALFKTCGIDAVTQAIPAMRAVWLARASS